MASGSSRMSEDQFLCSICLDVFTDPITTPCGHNYCKTCITQYWDSNVVCQCPLCKESFDRRPKSSVNKVLSEMADQFRNSKHSSTNLEPAKPDEVPCDFCTEPKLKAVRSCLVCLASYCEAHLEPHHRVTAFKRHKLIDPVNNLEDIMCKKHDRPLELFCKTDHTCVCQFCTEGDHKLHQTVSLKEAYEEKKAELGKMEAEVQQMIQLRQVKIHKVKHSVQLSNKAADREIADSVKVFTALISCIERSQAGLMNVIEEKKKKTERQAEGLIKELQMEITQLEKRSSELKQLSHTEDHLQLLQNFTPINIQITSKDWTKVSVPPSTYVGTARAAVDQLKKTLSKELDNQCAGAATGEIKEDCPILCLENYPQMEKLKCGHELCKDCMIRLLKTKGPNCPLCLDVFGKIEGDQPHGTMTWNSANFPLPGFPRCGTITIDYHIPGGTQTKKHPNPGRYYSGTQRRAYLPDNKEGKEVVMLLRKAFDQKLIFTIGTSRTSGSDNQVTWNDIHHKTNMSGGPEGFGYPDDNYLSRVKAELKAKGVE